MSTFRREKMSIKLKPGIDIELFWYVHKQEIFFGQGKNNIKCFPNVCTNKLIEICVCVKNSQLICRVHFH